MKRPGISTCVAVLLLCVAVAGLTTETAAQTVTTQNNLTFGGVVPGAIKTVSKATPGAAAEFLISGTEGDEILIDFSLPTHMESGANLLLLYFSDTDCALDSSAIPDQSSPDWDDQNPRSTITARLGSGGLTVWLGGSARPNTEQLPGSYSAEIVITVTLTGN